MSNTVEHPVPAGSVESDDLTSKSLDDATGAPDEFTPVGDINGTADARPGRRRLLAGVAAVVIATMGLFFISTLFAVNNRASALTGHPEVLRPGCTWDKSGNYVQNCKVWSKSNNKYVIVQIRASNGSNQGIYLLDGMRASEERSAWTTDVQAAKVYDGKTDTTLVMPVGGASSFYTDWDGGAGSDNKTIKQETFLTSELPGYLQENFGVSPSNNAIVGLSMSGGPAVTLAERHPEQFKVVQTMSGYYQTDNILGNLGVLATQTLVSNYANGVVNMWGAPGSQRWTDNDPSKNVNKLKENGQVLIISSGNGFLTKSEMAKLKPQDQVSAMLLEMLSAVSTVLFQLQAGQSGASVVSLPNYGGHTWENWGRALGDGKDTVLTKLRENPPVTTKTQLVSAEGSPDPEGNTKATAAVRQVAAQPTIIPQLIDEAEREAAQDRQRTDVADEDHTGPYDTHADDRNDPYGRNDGTGEPGDDRRFSREVAGDDSGDQAGRDSDDPRRETQREQQRQVPEAPSDSPSAPAPSADDPQTPDSPAPLPQTPDSPAPRPEARQLQSPEPQSAPETPNSPEAQQPAPETPETEHPSSEEPEPVAPTTTPVPIG